MSRKLVIHIGAQKCASSSLQASLDLLAEAAKDDLGFCHLKPELLRLASQALDKNEDMLLILLTRFLLSKLALRLLSVTKCWAIARDW